MGGGGLGVLFNIVSSPLVPSMVVAWVGSVPRQFSLMFYVAWILQLLWRRICLNGLNEWSLFLGLCCSVLLCTDHLNPYTELTGLPIQYSTLCFKTQILNLLCVSNGTTGQKKKGLEIILMSLGLSCISMNSNAILFPCYLITWHKASLYRL